LIDTPFGRKTQAVSAGVVLLLEDEALIAMDVEQTLAAEKLAVVCFASAADGVHWLESNTPALAVLDIGLIDGDCDEAAATLTRRHGCPLSSIPERRPRRSTVGRLQRGAGCPSPRAMACWAH